MPDSSPPRILIVDDEAAQMKALCDTLGENGYATAGFTSARLALAELRDRAFDLILTDLMMPEMDGIALLREAFAADPSLIGIMMTGEGTISSAVEAMKAGAFDYILKPFKLSVVLPVLARALSVRRLRLENAELQRKVADRTRELEAANKSLEAFSYSVSHDLRTPLRHIDGFSSLLLKRHAAEMSAESQRLLGLIISSAQRMSALIEDLLRFCRLGRQALSKRPIILTPIVEDVLRELAKETADREVDLRIGPLPDIVGDPSLLRQVFVNLFSNAFKFTRGRDKAAIEVGCLEREGERVFFVRDNGAGFDMKYAQKLFGVFQRMHRSEEFEGTGIGLSLVQRIVERHGGRIWAEAAVDQGATFYFTLG